MMSTLRILSIELTSLQYIARPESVSKLFGVNRVLERHTILFFCSGGYLLAVAIINSTVLGSVPTVLFLGYKVSTLRENLIEKLYKWG